MCSVGATWLKKSNLIENPPGVVDWQLEAVHGYTPYAYSTINKPLRINRNGLARL